MMLALTRYSGTNWGIHPYIQNFVRADVHSWHGDFVDF